MPDKPRLTTRLALGWTRRRAKRFPPPPFEKLTPDTTARILYVNTTGIGDTMFGTAALADLRESFPNAHLAAFVDRRRISLLENNPRIDRIVEYPGKFKHVRKVIRDLRETPYDYAIIGHANDPDVCPLLVMGGVKQIIGYEDHTFAELYSLRAPAFARTAGHTIDSRLNLCRAAGANGSHWQMELYPTDSDRKAALQVLDQLGVQEGQAIIMNLGGSAAYKRWPPVHWDAFSQMLSAQDTPGIFVGGPNEELIAEVVREHLGEVNSIHFAVGELNLMQTAVLTTMCKAVVTADTGLMHAALALDVPTVCLFGPDNPDWTGPYPKRTNSRVVNYDKAEKPEDYDKRKDDSGILMRTITAYDVMDALNELLES
ncbi:MAG: glycosyltransferase family 9 protein [Planctomycetes bacterium]|nr:glycosyltransferase family 9 protein [Planctomycetota bacterium]